MLHAATPGGLFPTLSPEVSPISYAVVGGTLIILAGIGYAAKRLKVDDPPAQSKPPEPAPTPGAGDADQAGGEVDASYEVLHDVIARLAAVQIELAGCRAHAETVGQRNKQLVIDLKATQQRLREARAQLVGLYGPDRQDGGWGRRPSPPPNAPSSGGLRAPTVVPPPPMPVNPDTPTDPIPGTSP